MEEKNLKQCITQCPSKTPWYFPEIQKCGTRGNHFAWKSASYGDVPATQSKIALKKCKFPFSKSGKNCGPTCASLGKFQSEFGTNCVSRCSSGYENQGGERKCKFEQLVEVKVCFPGASIVSTPDGKCRVDELEVGDLVLTPDGPSPVYAFLHYKPDQDAQYLRLNDGLRISENHFLAVHRPDKSRQARSSRRHDLHCRRRSTTKTIVSSIETVTEKGIFAPATLDGRLIVDGVLVSSYATAGSNHDAVVPGWGTVVSGNTIVSLGHAPLRLCARLTGCGADPTTYNHPEDEGYHRWTKFLMAVPTTASGDFNLWNPVVLLAFLFCFGAAVVDWAVSSITSAPSKPSMGVFFDLKPEKQS